MSKIPLRARASWRKIPPSSAQMTPREVGGIRQKAKKAASNTAATVTTNLTGHAIGDNFSRMDLAAAGTEFLFVKDIFVGLSRLESVCNAHINMAEVRTFSTPAQRCITMDYPAPCGCLR